MPHLNSRRQFILSAPVLGTALLAACSPPAPSEAPAAPVAPPAPMPAPAPAPDPAPGAAAPAQLLDEQSAQAVALGYVADASRVDKAKFPAFVAGSQCSNCALYQGQAGAADGPCPIFAGQRVTAGGWCSTWARKA